MGEVGHKQEKPILIFTNSQGSLTLLKQFVHHSHTKHRYLISFCEGSSTEEMIVDILITGVSENQIETCRSKLGLDQHE
jgi:hypothetical protein